MMIAYRALVLFLPLAGPVGEERKVELYWQPGGLEPGLWWMKVGGGQDVWGSRVFIQERILALFRLSPAARVVLDREMTGLDTQEPISCL